MSLNELVLMVSLIVFSATSYASVYVPTCKIRAQLVEIDKDIAASSLEKDFIPNGEVIHNTRKDVF